MEEVKVVVGRWVASPLVDDESPLEGLQVVEKKGGGIIQGRGEGGGWKVDDVTLKGWD